MKKIFALAVSVLFAFTSCNFKAEKNVPRTISVTGKGTVKLDNEKAVISLSVVTRSASVERFSLSLPPSVKAGIIDQNGISIIV